MFILLPFGKETGVWLFIMSMKFLIKSTQGKLSMGQIALDGGPGEL